ncbi:MAG: hypothetical protein ACJ72V_16870, partial [Nitrososphaeraceae archaeon]
VSTIIGDNQAKPGQVLETVKSETKDRSRGTKHSRQSETNLDLEPGDESDLRSQGVVIRKEEIRSSVTGQKKASRKMILKH